MVILAESLNKSFNMRPQYMESRSLSLNDVKVPITNMSG